MVVSSNLTGAFWDGALNYFPSCETLDSIYTTHVAKELFVGAADGLWADNVSVVIGTDEGTVSSIQCIPLLSGIISLNEQHFKRETTQVNQDKHLLS